MPTVGSAPAGDSENPARASMTSLPAFAYAVASGKTKNGAPLPVRFATRKSCEPFRSAAKAGVTKVIWMTFDPLVGTRLCEVLLTVPTATPSIVSCAPTAKPEATHDPPSVRVITPVRPAFSELKVTGTVSSWANGLLPKMPSDSTSVLPPYQQPSCDVSP